MPKKSVEKVAEVKETVKEAEVKETKAAAVKEERYFFSGHSYIAGTS